MIGDYIYFDGQLVSQNNTWRLVNQGSCTCCALRASLTLTPGAFPALVNATLAINLTESWSTDDVEIIEIGYESEPKQVLAEQAILIDETPDSFYAWGGTTSHEEVIRDSPELWMFESDGQGEGEWTNATPSKGDDIFFTIKRSRNSAYVSTPNTGFIFGGLTTPYTTREQEGSIAGFSTFDFKTKKWSYFEEGPYSPGRRIVGGRAVFAPEFGPDGLIFILGGIGDPTADGQETENYIGFKTIHFIDPVSKQWYSQETTGQEPSIRYDFCAVGVGHVAGNSTRFDM